MRLSAPLIHIFQPYFLISNKYSPWRTPFDSILLRVVLFQKQAPWFLSQRLKDDVVKVRLGLRLRQWRLFSLNNTCLIGWLFQIYFPPSIGLFRSDKRRHNGGGRLLRGGALTAGEGPRRGRGYYQLWAGLGRTGDRNIGGQALERWTGEVSQACRSREVIRGGNRQSRLQTWSLILCCVVEGQCNRRQGTKHSATHVSIKEAQTPTSNHEALSDSSTNLT